MAEQINPRTRYSVVKIDGVRFTFSEYNINIVTDIADATCMGGPPLALTVFESSVAEVVLLDRRRSSRKMHWLLSKHGKEAKFSVFERGGTERVDFVALIIDVRYTEPPLNACDVRWGNPTYLRGVALELKLTLEPVYACEQGEYRGIVRS